MKFSEIDLRRIVKEELDRWLRANAGIGSGINVTASKTPNLTPDNQNELPEKEEDEENKD